jgi:glycosyltransferase involved in cell wall biosynthesis
MSVRLSLAMIVKDEEQTIKRALESASTFCDEMIVLDTGSEDGTREAARDAGATVAEANWTDDFSEARNKSFDLCNGEWIMWLDGDDVVPPAAQGAFLAAKGRLDDEVDAVAGPYHSRLTPDGTPLLIRNQVRLVRQGAGLQWQGRVYEWIPVAPGRSTADSDLIVENRPIPERQVKMADRNLTLLDQAIASGDRSPRTLFHYGNELYDHGLFEEAELMYRQYLAVDDEGADRYWALLYLAESQLALNQADSANDTLLKAVLEDSSRAEAFLTLGRIRFEAEEWEEAIPFFAAASSARRPFFGYVRNPDYVFAPWDYLSVCYEKVGRMSEGILMAMNGLRANPEADRVRSNLHWMVDHL